MLLVIPTFIGISIITFVMLQFSPGNPVFMRLQSMQGAMGGNQISEEIIQQTKELYGMDKPIPQRYALWMWKMVRLDFGESFKDGRPVLERILEALPITLQLNITSLLLMYVISIPIGLYSATHQGAKTDSGITVGLFLLYSLPSFWVAMLLMYFFGGGGGSESLTALCARGFAAVGMGESGFAKWMLEHVLHFEWFPVYGFNSPGANSWGFWPWFWDRVWHLVLPVFCLTYASFAAMSRYARAGLLDVIRQDYIRTARAYGFSEWTVVMKYALRNAMIPIITLLGTLLPLLIGGSVIIESIFSIPGMGRLFYDSILGRDYPMVMGVFTFTAIITLGALILSDILYALTDPRIKFE